MVFLDSLSFRANACSNTVLGSSGQTAMGLLNVWPSYTSSIYASNETTPLSAPMTQAEDSLLGSLPSLGIENIGSLEFTPETLGSDICRCISRNMTLFMKGIL